MECYVTDEEEAYYIMERIHSGEDSGRGLKQWTAREKEIFKTRLNGRVTTAYLIDLYVKKYNAGLDITTILPFTTIQRIFDKRTIKNEIGLNTNDERSFTKGRMQLIIDASKWAVRKSNEEGLGVTRVFNTAKNIEDLLLPWIKEYKTQLDTQEQKSTYLNVEEQSPIMVSLQEEYYGRNLKKSLNHSSDLLKQGNKNASELENKKATANQSDQKLFDDKINDNIALPNQIISSQKDNPYIEGTRGEFKLTIFFSRS